MGTSLLGLAVLVASLYQLTWKRRLPDFLHPIYKNQEQFYNEQNNKELTDVLRFLNAIVGFICVVAPYNSVQLIIYPSFGSIFWPVRLSIAGIVAYFFADRSPKELQTKLLDPN